jgi:CRISPR-associated protein Cas5
VIRNYSFSIAMNLDLEFLLQPPEWAVKAKLNIEALTPLSMVTSMPGKYYRCQPEPTQDMLYALLENALGWHISSKERSALLRKMQKKHKAEARESGVGYKSLLQFHLRFATAVIPPMVHYDDYWSQHLKGASFVGGSRNYDYRAIPLMNALRAGHIIVNDTSNASKNKNKIREFSEGDNIHLNVLRPYFPQYYASPTPRGYVVPKGPYQYLVETSPNLSKMIAGAIATPAAPLYLGTNDGWVELSWEMMQ